MRLGEDFSPLVGELPLARVSVEPWQVEYDLAWARKQS